MLRRSAGENAILAGAMVTYVAVCWLVARANGVPFSLKLYGVLWLGLAGAIAVFAVARPVLPKSWRLAERLILAGPVLVLAPAFFAAFTSLKSGISHLHPYTWDASLAAADRSLLGDDAWRLLQPALGRPAATFVLSCLYSAWHPAMIAVFGGLTLSLGVARLRAQALLAMVACWALLGTWAAIELASVGPCFAGPLHAADGRAFVDQAIYLRHANRALPIWEFAEQGRLLSAAGSGRPTLGSGISAMPSMHVAVAFLMMMIGWRLRAWAGVLGTAYLVVVMLASVHLGWHYAVDGLAAVAGAAALWLIAGLVARRMVPAPPPQVPTGAGAGAGPASTS
jgi:hypothetical protein